MKRPLTSWSGEMVSSTSAVLVTFGVAVLLMVSGLGLTTTIVLVLLVHVISMIVGGLPANWGSAISAGAFYVGNALAGAIPGSMGALAVVAHVALAGLLHWHQLRQSARFDESRARLEALLKVLPTPVAIADKSGRAVLVNRALYDVWGENAPPLMNVDSYADYKAWWPNGHRLEARDWPIVRALITGELVMDEEVKIETFRGERKTMLVYAVPIRDEHDEIIGAAALSVDVTHRKQVAEQLADMNRVLEQRVSERTAELENRARELAESEARYRAISDAIPLGVWTADVNGWKDYLSPSLLEMLGMTLEEARDLGWTRRVPEEDREAVIEAWKRTAREGTEWNAEVRINGTDGKQYTILSRGTPVRDSQGNVESWVGITLDLTERKHMEQRLRALGNQLEHRAAQLRRLASELTLAEQRERRRVAELLHEDLAQLLVTVRMHLHQVRRNSTDASSRETAELIMPWLDRAIQTTRTLTTRLSPPILYQLGLGPALEWFADVLKNTADLNIELHIDEDAEPEDEDLKVLLFHAARELLRNIEKHAGTTEAEVALRHVDDHIELTVTDRGRGFDPDRVEQASSKLGLFNIRERLDVLGGSIDIQSTPGEGTRIVLRAPTSLRAKPERAEAEHLPIEAVPRDGDSDQIRALVVDDHDIVRAGLVEMLQKEADVEVVGQAGDGMVALDLAAQLHPDVVILDVIMPGIDGIETARRLRAMLPQVCIIGLSVHRTGQIVDAMLKAGADAYLSKDEPIEALMATIRDCHHEVLTHPRIFTGDEARQDVTP